MVDLIVCTLNRWILERILVDTGARVQIVCKSKISTTKAGKESIWDHEPDENSIYTSRLHMIPIRFGQCKWLLGLCEASRICCFDCHGAGEIHSIFFHHGKGPDGPVPIVFQPIVWNSIIYARNRRNPERILVRKSARTWIVCRAKISMIEFGEKIVLAHKPDENMIYVSHPQNMRVFRSRHASGSWLQKVNVAWQQNKGLESFSLKLQENFAASLQISLLFCTLKVLLYSAPPSSPHGEECWVKN